MTTVREIKLSFNDKPVGLVLVKYITYEFNDKGTNEGHKELECLDSSNIVKIALSNDPHPPDSANMHEMLFTLDSMFLRYESRDKLGETINLQYIPIKYIIDIDVWRHDFDIPNVKEFSKQTRRSLK